MGKSVITANGKQYRGMTKTVIRDTYNTIMKLGNPTNLDIRRALPNHNSTSIGKSTRYLMDMGAVRKDNEWPPHMRVIGPMPEEIA